MLQRQWRREVTHCELFANLQALVAATTDFFGRHNRRPDGVRSILGAHPA
jgi:putative transposase